MKIELTMTELLLIIDMIKNGTEQDNEGEMKTPMQELMDEFAKKADSLPDTLDANVAYLAFQECYDIAKSKCSRKRCL
jgi:hypothetical protein